MDKNRNWLRSALSILLLLTITVGMLGCKPSVGQEADWTTQTTGSVSNTDPTDTISGETTEAKQGSTDGTTPAQTEGSAQEDLPAPSDPSIPDKTQPDATQPAETTQSTQPPEPTQAPRPTEPPQPAETVKPTEPTAPVQPSTPTVSGQLKVHFIDVGQADAALVQCDGKNMLIDGGNAADSNLMYAYLKKHNVTYLDYVIGTHGHEDHIGGIPGALQYADVGTVYCPVTSYSSTAFSNFSKAVQNRGKSIQVPSVGTSFSLGGASVKILAVNTAFNDPNNTSIVLRITYGSTSFLFTGDAELEVEQALIDRGASLKSTVLKVGHHGSASSTSYQFLWHVMPQYAVISVGKGNTYGHPTYNVLSRLRDADAKLFRTDMQGDIIATSNGSSVSFKVARNANADTFGGIGNNSTQEQPEEQTYIINKNSGLFHKPDCGAVENMNPKNKQEYTGTKEELVEQGYTPCGWCDP